MIPSLGRDFEREELKKELEKRRLKTTEGVCSVCLSLFVVVVARTNAFCSLSRNLSVKIRHLRERERPIQREVTHTRSTRTLAGEKKNNNNEKKKKKMGKRELAQIIAAQEWHDPTKWVSKKNTREEEVHTDDNTVLDPGVKKVRKSTEEIRKKKTSAKQKPKTKKREEESRSKSSKSTRETTVVDNARSKSVTPASEEEKKDLEDDDDDPVTFDLSLGNVGAATGKKGTLTSAEKKRKEIEEEEKEEEKEEGAVIKEPETTFTTNVEVKEEEGSPPPPPFPLNASAKKAPIVEREKGENGVSHSPPSSLPPQPTKLLDDEEKIKEDPEVVPLKETVIASKKVSPPTLPTLIDHVKALEEGREELPILKPILPVCFYCRTNSHCVETNGMSSLVECGRFAEVVNTKPMYAITSRFAEGTKERLAVEHALVNGLSSFGKTKSKEEKFAHGTVTGAEEYEMEQKLTRPSSHPTGVVIQDVAAVAEKKQHRKTPAAEKKQSYTAKLQEFKRIRQVNRDNEDLGLFDAAATLRSFSIGMKTVSGNKSSGSGGSIKKMKNPSTPSAADADGLTRNNAAVAEKGKIECTKTGRIKKAKKKYKKSVVGTLDPASERKRKYKEGVENFLKLATIQAHMKEPDDPNFLHRPASLRTKVELDALTLFSGGKWRLVQGEDMSQANEAVQEESARQSPEENLSYEEALQRSTAEKEAKMLAAQKGHEEDKKEDDEKSNPLREDANLGAKDMMEKRGIQTTGEYAAVESKEDDATSKNPLEEELAKVRKVTDDLPPGTKSVTKPTTSEDRALQTMVSTETKTTKSSGSKSKYSIEGMKFQRVEPPPDYEKPILQAKRKRFANNPSFGITRAMIEQRFHMPLREAATELGVGRTTFKRVLRLHGIERWPSQSLNTKKLTMKTITSLMSLPMSRMENNLDAQTLDSPSLNTTLEDKERDEEQKKQMESLSNSIFTKNSNGTNGEGRPRIPDIALNNNNIMNLILNGAAAGISPEKSNLYSLGGNIAAASQGNKSLKTSDLRGMSDLRNYNANVNALADNVTFGSLRGLSDNTFNNNNNTRA